MPATKTTTTLGAVGRGRGAVQWQATPCCPTVIACIHCIHCCILATTPTNHCIRCSCMQGQLVVIKCMPARACQRAVWEPGRRKPPSSCTYASVAAHTTPHSTAPPRRLRGSHRRPCHISHSSPWPGPRTRPGPATPTTGAPGRCRSAASAGTPSWPSTQGRRL